MAKRKKSKNTPARQQYLDIKANFPDTIVLFRLGDFYECFDADAETVARELDITLTSRNVSKSDRIPMAGVPHHAVEGYIAKLIDKGYHVAVVDQVGSDPVDGLVPREVAQIVTPGTVTEASMLRDHQNNYLMALAFHGDADQGGFSRAGIAYVDITTGEYAATEVEGESAPVKVLEEITRLAPREVLMPRKWADAGATLPAGSHLTARPDFHFDYNAASNGLQKFFRVRNLDGFGLGQMPLAVCAAGAILEYVRETQRGGIEQITSLRSYSTDHFMTLDTFTRRNLELTETLRGAAIGSLLNVLDRTVTSMGARLLRQWIGQPLLELSRLDARLAAVSAFFERGPLRAEITEHLRHVSDIERLTSRLLAGRTGPRDLIALAEGLRIVPELRERLAGIDSLGAIYERLDTCEEAVYDIEDTLVEEPPVTLNTPGAIRKGVSDELDEIYRMSREARDYIADLESVERERTGIKTLKVGYNKVFGYYIEISKGAASQAPDDYERRQTLVNAERYITPQMKEYENIILNADERILEIERRIFEDLNQRLKRHAQAILKTARAVAHLDCFVSLAEVAVREGYVCPALTDEDIINIQAGRHPVVEKMLKGERFVPNNCYFDGANRIHLITGPNMAGKSTVMRQVALIVLMAQIGSFVPAEAATIGLVDRIFTRVGAQDEIHSGQSTFMVEMVETANILVNATPRSLVILDEIGRGTSTYDGMAIARAVMEYIHNSPHLGCKTMFATHYHELTELERILPRVVNYNVAVAEEGETVVFLHHLVEGKADRSYGIYVAQLAGVPPSVVKRASEILEELETQGSDFAQRQRQKESEYQLSLFDDSRHPVIDELQKLKIEQMSPIDAITRLYELQRLANDGE